MAVTSIDNSAVLTITNVSKTFHGKEKDVKALENVSLNIGQGEFVSLIGPSGCGKTTLLRLIAGLENNYEGNVLLEGNRIGRPGLDRGVIFQEHRLLPWLTISENIALGMEGKKSYIKDKVRIYLKKVGLEDFEKAYPRQLSGGMAQRASIARALIRQPKILLLDEPLGALDALTKMNMQAELERIWMADKTTMIMVTHDIEEAIFLGDRVVVMSARPGEIKSIFHIELPRPRNRSSREFAEYRTSIINTFHETIGMYNI